MAERAAAEAGTRVRPVRARLAASLVLLRSRDGRREVLLGRRSKEHAFVPGMYVFPGGAVERGDARLPALDEPAAPVRDVLHRRLPPARARALAVTAVRETFEETGLLLGRLHEGRPRPSLGRLLYVARAITPAALPRRFDARFFAAELPSDTAPVASPTGELLDLRWLPLDAVDEHLPMLRVTRFVLERVAALEAWRQPERVPLFAWRGRSPLLRDE